MFDGYFPALITPFRDDAVDEAAYRKLINWQISQGVAGLVPVGTTGESPTLTVPEHERVVALCVETAAGRVPVIAGAGSNETRISVDFVRHAKTVGADAALVVTPYYNKPNQDGLYAHFMAIAEAVELPIFIYNIPGRSVIDMSVETMAKLARHPNIIGVKDATADMSRVTKQRRECGHDFIQLSGDDNSALGMFAHGGRGCISVTANVAPGLCAELGAAALAGDYDRAREINDRLGPLHAALFCSPSPGPTKYVLNKLGVCAPEVRLPVTPPDAAACKIIDAAVEHAQLPPVD
ncbi:MAG: 4-hydroxy-tetrahydrodipicolinate synthase [Maricaulaceae bacterium]|jgi:4-hydroxy-tetrahydrodipicolinate synthase